VADSPEVGKLQNKLNGVLTNIVKKAQKKDKFNDRDIDLLEKLIEEFDGHKFAASDFLASDFGKIFRTINHVISKNKDLLPKSQDNITTSLTKVIHKIKYRVLKNFLDNSELLEKHGIEKEAEGSRDRIRTEELSDSSSPKKPATKQDARLFANGKTSAGTDESPIKNDGDPFLILRKKVCQKYAKILQTDYNMEKEKSQELTLEVEGKIHLLSQGNQDDYKNKIKALHNLLKAQSVTIEELGTVQYMDLKKFNELTASKGKVGNSDEKDGKRSDKKSAKKKDDEEDY